MGHFPVLSLGWLAIFISLSGAKGYQCPQDWLPGNGLCYKVFGDQKTWNDAEMFCRKLKPGCHLASIHSMADSFALADYVADYLSRPGQVWIGLNKPENKQIWEWSDKSYVDYYSWNPGQPDNKKNNEFCVHLWAPAGFFKWNDTPCEALHPFICQCKY